MRVAPNMGSDRIAASKGAQADGPWPSPQGQPQAVRACPRPPPPKSLGTVR